MHQQQINTVLDDPQFPEEFPLTNEQMSRLDQSDDSFFYDSPRFVTHIDDNAIKALTNWYAQNLPRGNKDKGVLDLCSSWVSHLPSDYVDNCTSRIAGLGMNEEELKNNKVLTEWNVKDLNKDPTLPYDNQSFDAVVCAVSIDYLVYPVAVCSEINRVLKPGGLAAFSFSNRCFPTKVVQIWTSLSDRDKCWLVGSYFHYAGGFDKPQAEDISPAPGRTDPMYVVSARKSVHEA